MVPCCVVAAVKSKERIIDFEKGEELAKELNPGQYTPYMEIEIEDNDKIMSVVIIPFVRTMIMYKILNTPPSTLSNIFHSSSQFSGMDDLDSLNPMMSVSTTPSTLIYNKLKKKISNFETAEKWEGFFANEKNLRRHFFFVPISEIHALVEKESVKTHRKGSSFTKTLSSGSIKTHSSDDHYKFIKYLLENIEKNAKILQNDDIMDSEEIPVILTLMKGDPNTGWDEFTLPILIHPSETRDVLYHTGILIGSWYLEWNSTEICIPRRVIIPNFGSTGLNLGKTTKRGIDTVIEVILDYNNKKCYKDTPEKENEGNCQTFVEDVLDHLQIEIEFQGALANFLKKMKQTGGSNLIFEPHDRSMRNSYRDIIPILEDRVSKDSTRIPNFEFNSHKDLDEFVAKTVEKFDVQDVSGLATLFKSEFSLLRLFDGTLWYESLWRSFIKKETLPNCNCQFTSDYKTVQIL